MAYFLFIPSRMNEPIYIDSRFDGKAKDTPIIYIALIEQGTNVFMVDGLSYAVSVGDLFVLIQSRQPLSQQPSEDYSARVALLSREYVNGLHIPHTYSMFLSLRRNPVLHLDEDAWQQINSCFSLIKSTLHHTNNAYRKQTIYYAIKTYLFTLAFLSQADDERHFTREQDLTTQFMDLLEENYRTQHSVSFYAEQMHLSVKYVSTTIKTTTGKTAMECIASRLLEQAQKLLMQPLTISEVCYELGFLTPSAFGKFFRTHTGLGPRQWRKLHPTAP